ncbi:hypothetical protein HPB48_020820 [Haemaphysalis longicornis]|uniref:Uncharacterized protein n=1 Tax=Haemaphysalis longicornis TaxID=44386 RepID=A0A9J6H1G6_HAELO|nr:hypothetical protein HPB48_020820 [Haemaphysalis longicornis]
MSLTQPDPFNPFPLPRLTGQTSFREAALGEVHLPADRASNAYTTFSSMRYSRGTRWRWYLSIGKNGHVKRGRRPRQKGTNFLPRSVNDFKP